MLILSFLLFVSTSSFPYYVVLGLNNKFQIMDDSAIECDSFISCYDALCNMSARDCVSNSAFVSLESSPNCSADNNTIQPVNMMMAILTDKRFILQQSSHTCNDFTLCLRTGCDILNKLKISGWIIFTGQCVQRMIQKM